MKYRYHQAHLLSLTHHETWNTAHAKRHWQTVILNHWWFLHFFPFQIVWMIRSNNITLLHFFGRGYCKFRLYMRIVFHPLGRGKPWTKKTKTNKHCIRIILPHLFWFWIVLHLGQGKACRKTNIEIGLRCCNCFSFGLFSINLGKVSHTRKKRTLHQDYLVALVLALDCFPFTREVMQQKNMALGLFCCICFGFGCGKGFLFDAWFVFSLRLAQRRCGNFFNHMKPNNCFFKEIPKPSKNKSLNAGFRSNEGQKRVPNC